MKQVRNFLNNSPFKMYGANRTPAKFNKPLREALKKGELNGNPKFKAAVDASAPVKMYKKSAPLKETKSKGAYVKKGGKATGNMKDYAIGSKARYNEYESRGWKQDDTTKKGAPKPETKRETRPVKDLKDLSRISSDSMTSEIKTPEVRTIKKLTRDDIAASARITKNKKIAAKAKAALEKKQKAAATQKQNMKDKIKLKQEIKDLKKTGTRKKRKENLNTSRSTKQEAGQSLTDQDLIKKKRKAKRQKGKAIRKYKKDPNNFKVAKVKKEKKSKVKNSVTSKQNSMVRE